MSDNHKELRERLRRIVTSIEGPKNSLCWYASIRELLEVSEKDYLALLDLIDRLEREKEDLREQALTRFEDFGFWGRFASHLKKERDALRREKEELRKDAERYRWLTENAEISTPGWLHDGNDPASTKAPLDAAIDAAMKEDSEELRALAAEYADDGVEWYDRPKRCPACNSPDPAKHPATSLEGEIYLCKHSWHEQAMKEEG